MTTSQTPQLDWLIVGGGIHGTTISLALTRQRGVDRARLRVLDPHEHPLARWEANTANVGMAYLRSPHVQTLDADPWSLSTFSKTRRGEPLAEFIPTHNRPSLALFQAHSDWVRQRHRLDDLRVQGRATGLERIDGGWRVESTAGALAAHSVVLAFGAGEQPRWPDWATPLREADAPVNHIFEDGFQRDALPDWRQAVVIGGGISAAQVALALAVRQPGSVTLLTRHLLRLHAFDSDLGWVAGSELQAFRATTDYTQRRQIIREARHTGSVPADVAALVEQAQREGVLDVRVGEVTNADAQDGNIGLELAGGGLLVTDRLLLATGFDPRRPGGPWLDAAIRRYGLPLAADGYPIPGEHLAWADGLYVSGPLAELEVGPVARNIIGARLAAEMIVRAVRG